LKRKLHEKNKFKQYRSYILFFYFYIRTYFYYNMRVYMYSVYIYIYIYISLNEPTRKDKIRDTRARVFLIGECGGKRSCHGLLTGPLPHQPPQPLPTMPTPPTPMPRPPCAPLPAAVVRSAAAGRWRHREPVVDRRHPCTAGPVRGADGGRRAAGSSAADRNRTKTTLLPLTRSEIGRIHRPCSAGYGTVFGHRFFGRDSISTRPPHGFFSLAPLTLPRTIRSSVSVAPLVHARIIIIIIIIVICIKAAGLRTLPPSDLVVRGSHRRRRRRPRRSLALARSGHYSSRLKKDVTVVWRGRWVRCAAGSDEADATTAAAIFTVTNALGLTGS